MPYYQVVISKRSTIKYLVQESNAWEVARRAYDNGIDEDSETVLKHMGDEIEDVEIMDETGMEMIDPYNEEDEEEENDTDTTDEEEQKPLAESL